MHTCSLAHSIYLLAFILTVTSMTPIWLVAFRHAQLTYLTFYVFHLESFCLTEEEGGIQRLPFYSVECSNIRKQSPARGTISVCGQL